MEKEKVPVLEIFEGKIYYDIHEGSEYGKRLSREDVTDKAVIVAKRDIPWAAPKDRAKKTRATRLSGLSPGARPPGNTRVFRSRIT